MSFLLTIRIALRALAKNKMRAGLTVLGVFALWRFGAWEERVVGAMVIALLGLVQLVEPFQIGTWRAAS